MTWRNCWKCKGAGEVVTDSRGCMRTTAKCGVCKGEGGWDETNDRIQSTASGVTSAGSQDLPQHNPERPCLAPAEERGVTEPGSSPGASAVRSRAQGRSGALPLLSASQALHFGAPCRVETAPGFAFVHDEERPDRLYAEGLLPQPRRF